jgi:hypothetical protein
MNFILAEDWSPAEVAATVADYFAMLEHELRGEAYNKKEHNRVLQQLLRARSAGAVEFKHANISAVLIELGFPYIDGYKPRSNYQELLKDEVASRLQRDASVTSAAAVVVEASAETVPAVLSLADVVVPAPVRERERNRSYERRVPQRTLSIGVDYLAREAQNASLGRAGEEFALNVEHRRLWEAGLHQFAERIEHVSRTQGDGLGYDIVSFESNGQERLIEVKTTSFGAMTPFFASKREVAVSEERSRYFHLYRVFKFRESPQVFFLPGSLRESCDLDPLQYRASLL